MKNVKNRIGKTICRVDAEEKTVEILYKGIKTLIRFLPGEKVEITDVKQK